MQKKKEVETEQEKKLEKGKFTNSEHREQHNNKSFLQA